MPLPTENLSMRDVLRWIDRHNGAPALEILASRNGEDAPATDLLAGIVATDSREQSGIWSTASGVLAAYRTEGALASTRAEPLDMQAFCSGPNTLYVCATGRRQRQFAPLVVAIIGDVRDAAYARSRDGHDGPPTLFALDEVANIAPIPDLPAMVSEGAGQGLLTLACLQDLSQARSRWGPAADGFLSLFGTTVVLRGIADTSTLRDISALAGDHEWPRRRSADRWTAGAASVPRRRSAPRIGCASRWTPWPTARPGRRSYSGPTRRCTDVALTPAHARSPWREVLPPARQLASPGRAWHGR